MSSMSEVFPVSPGTDQDVEACRELDIKAIQESILNLDLLYQHFHTPALFLEYMSGCILETWRIYLFFHEECY